jgi:hypothetical protein
MARWNICNVFSPAGDANYLWQFSSSHEGAQLKSEGSHLPTESLPGNLINKSWADLWQSRINIAWLPVDKVFFRVLQLPESEPAEMASMIELQLEKLSPLPPAQIVWSFTLLPQKTDNLRTAIVVIAARSFVEEFLGQLEGRGFLSDRLEVPFLDQLLSTRITEDGVWIYPLGTEEKASCLVVWWYGGVLRNLSLAHLPASENRAQILREQLAQMTWAGELEGWLNSPPRWHLVADAPTAALWEPILNPSLDQPFDTVAPVAGAELAGLTAQRAAPADPRINLVPPEFLAHYKQEFVDRIWMRGLGALLVLYLAGLVIYFGSLEVYKFHYRKIDKEAKALEADYKKAEQLKAKVEVLQNQLNLQFAALDAWKAAAELLPDELTLESLGFEKGKTLRLFGSAPLDANTNITHYNKLLSEATVQGQPLFSRVASPTMNRRQDLWSWSFVCDLKQGEKE